MYSKNLCRNFFNNNYIINKSLATVATQLKQQPQQLKSYDEIPGPKKYPILGNVLDFKAFGGEFDPMQVREFQNVLQAKFGDIVRWNLFSEKQVYLFNPDHIKLVFKADSTSPLGAPHRPAIEPLLKLHEKIGISKTLLNSQNERWRKMRSASNPILVKPQTIHSYAPNQSEVANDMINVINEKFDKNSNVLHYEGFEKLLRLLALEYVSEIVFNHRLKCVNEKTRLPDVTELVMKIDTFFVLLGKLSFNLKTWKYFPTKDWRDFEEVGTYVYDVVRKYISEGQEKLNSSSDVKKTIMGQYLERKDKYGLEINDIVAIMTDLLIAGVDTTATAHYFLLYELGKNPEVQQELYEEIKRVVGDNRIVNEDHFEKLKFLKNCVKESLRIHNNAPANARKLNNDLVIDQYLIPKDTLMILSTTYITKSERFFKNAHKFDPHRWERAEVGAELIDPYANLPFGFGARMCIGRRIAEQEIYLSMIKLLQNYKIEYRGEAPGIKFGIVLAPDRPLNLYFTKRN